METELEPGLLLHLDPDALVTHGATFTGTDKNRVLGGHFYLCTSHGPESGTWVPLFSKGGPGRIPISTVGRTGYWKWTQGTFHYHPGQVWTASRSQIVAAALAGGDRSRPGSRNLLHPTYVPSPPANGLLRGTSLLPRFDATG